VSQGFLPVKVETNVCRWGYAGLRGACGRGLGLKCSRMPMGICLAPLGQFASRMHPRSSRVPRETSGLARIFRQRYGNCADTVGRPAEMAPRSAKGRDREEPSPLQAKPSGKPAGRAVQRNDRRGLNEMPTFKHTRASADRRRL